jgi:hypothetical protein
MIDVLARLGVKQQHKEIDVDDEHASQSSQSRGLPMRRRQAGSYRVSGEERRQGVSSSSDVLDRPLCRDYRGGIRKGSDHISEIYCASNSAVRSFFIVLVFAQVSALRNACLSRQSRTHEVRAPTATAPPRALFSASAMYAVAPSTSRPQHGASDSRVIPVCASRIRFEKIHSCLPRLCRLHR